MLFSFTIHYALLSQTFLCFSLHLFLFVHFISKPLSFPIYDPCKSDLSLLDHSLFDQDSSSDPLPFSLLLIWFSFLLMLTCCLFISFCSCNLYFECFLIVFIFVVLWVTVMGPKPARIKGNSLFYPFSCESKASAEVQHYCLF